MATRYERIADALRRGISSGELLAGARLPAEAELARQHRVGTPTVRRALEVLQDEGLVEKHHGVGSFVRLPPQRVTYVGSGHAPELRMPEVDLDIHVSARQIEAQTALADLLHVPEGTPLNELTYLSRYDNAPYGLARVYVPNSVADVRPARETWSPWGDDVRMRLVMDGVRIAATVERITARHPTRDEAETLRLPLRTPVLAVQRTSTDIEGRVVEATLLALPGDRTEALFTSPAPCKELEEAST